MNYITRKVKAFGKISYYDKKIIMFGFFFNKGLFVITDSSLKADISLPTEKVAISPCFSSVL